MSGVRQVRRELASDPVLAAAFRSAAWTGPPPRSVRRRWAGTAAALLVVGLVVAGQADRDCPVPVSSGRAHPVACPQQR